MTVIGFAVSGAVSGVLSYAELVGTRRKVPCVQASLLVMARMLVEASAGALSYSLITAALSGSVWFTGPWSMLVAGLCGSALLRSQLALLGSGQESSSYGPATVYRRLQKTIDKEIWDIDSAVTDTWIHNKVLPKLDSLEPKILAERAEAYLGQSERISSREITKVKKFFSDVVNDNNTEDDDKRRALVVKVVDVGGKRFVRRLTRK